jgi:AcrR family transcriptional regulator
VRSQLSEASRGGGVVVGGGLDRQGAHVSGMQRRRLLLAVVELVAEEGLEGASVGRVCKRAGVSRRTFYELFDDREACFLAAFDAAVERVSESVLLACGHESKWSARVRVGLTALLGCFDSEPGLARVCVVETLRGGGEVSERRKRVLDVLTVVIDEGRSESKRANMLPPLTAQGIVGGALSVIHAHLLAHPQTRAGECRPLLELVNPLMGMIVYPYLGAAAASRELERPTPDTPGMPAHSLNDPFRDLPIRFTYRTALVLATIATDPGASNRSIAEASGIEDEGQMSRLLRRLQRAGLTENHSDGQPKGEPNAWALTERGQAVHAALAGKAIDLRRM